MLRANIAQAGHQGKLGPVVRLRVLLARGDRPLPSMSGMMMKYFFRVERAPSPITPHVGVLA